MPGDLKTLLHAPEKRHYQRLDVLLDVSLEFNGQKIEATTSNISCGGMFLPDIHSMLAVEADIVVFVSLPDHTQLIKLPARVRRVDAKLESKKIGVALEFSRLYDDSRLQIDRYVKWKLLH